MAVRISTIAPVVYPIGGAGVSGVGSPLYPNGNPRRALPADGLLTVGYNGALFQDTITLTLEEL